MYYLSTVNLNFGVKYYYLTAWISLDFYDFSACFFHQSPYNSTYKIKKTGDFMMIAAVIAEYQSFS